MCVCIIGVAKIFIYQTEITCHFSETPQKSELVGIGKFYQYF